MVKKLEVNLEGRHAHLFDQALAEANRAPGRPLEGDELATALITAILEDDAAHAAHAAHEAPRLHS